MATTFYPFHRWIESGSTAETVVSTFGYLWDGDEVSEIALEIFPVGDAGHTYLIQP